jgi:SAM-dependent methyltransferase
MIAHRSFDNYDEYVYKQGGKARGRREHLLAHVAQNTEGFARTFERAARYLKPGAILCLGARTGAESIGAARAGFAGSVGIDLHPVGPTVLQGDWHDLAFPAGAFQNVYSNSLDHCLYLDKLAAQVQRVLVKGGRFYVMATNRQDATVEAWMAKGGNEALYWQTSDELRDAIADLGFTVLASWRDGKWGHYVFGVK